MRLYLKGDYTKKIPFGRDELAHKMWVSDIDGKEFSISWMGNDESLQEDFDLTVSDNKWRNDERWRSEEILKLDSQLKHEGINLQFEDAAITDYHSKREMLIIFSEELEILTVDKRAMYIMAIEVASAIDGQISEDDKATWLSVDEFKKKHEEILSLTYAEAIDLGLEEIKTIESVDEPFWDYQEKEQKAYLVNFYSERYQWPEHVRQRFESVLESGEVSLWIEELKPVAKKIYEEWVDETSFGF